jgi:hypothetical protein
MVGSNDTPLLGTLHQVFASRGEFRNSAQTYFLFYTLLGGVPSALSSPVERKVSVENEALEKFFLNFSGVGLCLLST